VLRHVGVISKGIFFKQTLEMNHAEQRQREGISEQPWGNLNENSLLVNKNLHKSHFRNKENKITQSYFMQSAYVYPSI